MKFEYAEYWGKLWKLNTKSAKEKLVALVKSKKFDVKLTRDGFKYAQAKAK